MQKCIPVQALMLACGVVFGAGVEARAIEYGPDVLVNGGFDLNPDEAAVPDGWTRSVMPEGHADVKIVGNRQDQSLMVRFHSPHNVNQARLMQEFEVEPGKVYELSFRYKTSVGEGLRADVLLTGTGPLYRSYYMPPAPEWTWRRCYLHVPEHEDPKAAIYMQNRSAETIWYDDVSLRATDIAPEDMAQYQPEVVAQSVSTEDQLLFPGSGRPTAEFIYRVEAAEGVEDRLDTTAWLLTADGRYVEADATDGRVSVDTSQVAPGKNQLFVFVTDPRDGARLAHAGLEIERIAEGQLDAGAIDLRQPAVFRDREGRPVFPIGMYGLGLTNDTELAELKQAGFTTIHNYAFEGDPGDRMERHHRFLDQAQAHGLNVMVGFPRFMAEKPGRSEQLGEWITQLRDHPANLFYTSDEMYIMRHAPRAQFASVDRTIEQSDPDAQWIIYDIPHESFAGHADGVMMVVKDEVTAKLARIRLGSDTVVFAVWGQPHYKKAKAPSAEMTRYSVFMPVILGSRGWFYWWYQTLLGNNGEHDLLKERLFENTRLLAEIGPALVSEDAAPAWVDSIQPRGDALFCSGTLGNQTYVLAAVPADGEGGGLDLPQGVEGRVQHVGGDETAQQRFDLEPSGVLLLRVTAEPSE